MALSQGKMPLFDFLNAKKEVITNLGATATLSVDDSFATVILNRAAGTVVTLPLAVPGLTYDFVVTTSVTSNAFKVITGAATEFLIGGYTNVDTGSSNAVAVFTGNGSTHVSVNMNGTTTGGLVGTVLRFTCLSNTRWLVEGMNMASGAATAFATS